MYDEEKRIEERRRIIDWAQQKAELGRLGI